MLNSKKISKILVSLVLILVISFSIVFVAMQVNKTNNDANLSVSAVSDTSVNNLFFAEPYGITIDEIGCPKCNSDPKVGQEASNPYREAPWNGRIKCLTSIPTNNYHRLYTLELNVDVRDVLIFNDDVIVEFKFYYQEPNLGLKKTHKISSLSIETKFFGEKNNTTPKIRTCSNTSSAGFTIQGGQKTYKVTVKVSYTFINDFNYGSEYVSEDVYFEFSGSEPCEHERSK